MTYAQFDHAMMYVWFVYVPVLLVGLVWAAWVLLWDEPRRLRRERREHLDRAMGHPKVAGRIVPAPPPPEKRRLPPGVRLYREKWRVAVEVGSRTHRRTTSTLFPLDTPTRVLRAWQESARTRLRADLDADRELTPLTDSDAPLTLDDAADTYLRTVTAMASYESRAADLLAWTRALGETPLPELATHALKLTWNGWVRTKVAKSTLNHRRTALLQCLAHTVPALVPMVKAALPHQGKHKGTPKELPLP